jgi:leader peptidase (prepilin peptidase)/N-methyltransferase
VGLNELLGLLGPWIALVLGLVAGSFANVCIHRLPRGESVVAPPSHCPACGARVRWHDNVPLLGYTLLRGRCRDCAARISPRYPLVEAASGLIFLGLWYHAGGDVVRFGIEALFALGLVVGTGIDLEHRLLPDRVTLPLLGWALAASVLPGGLTPAAALIGALAGGAALYLIALLGDAVYRRDTMGGGDIKLAAAMGALLGWQLLVVALFSAFVLGAVGGLAYLALGGRDRMVPFGPFLAAGALLALTVGPGIWTWYLGFFA